MFIWENVMIGIGLSMDALMIAFAKGYTWKKNQLIVLAIFFGLFQSIMTLTGYIFGKYFIPIDFTYKNIVMFVILCYIGIKMLQDNPENNEIFGIFTIITLSILTSIDAFSIGISISLYTHSILKVSTIIGIITFTMSLAGSMIGYHFHEISINKSNKIGGIIIILYAVRVLLSK